MKKAMAAFAIILAVALIGTIGFGVAVGSDTMRRIWLEDSNWSQLIHGINSISNTDTDATSWDDETIDGSPVFYEETKNFSAAQENRVEITADIGAVRVHPTQDGATKATLRLYGNRDKGYNPYDFSIAQQPKTTDIALRSTSDLTDGSVWRGIVAVRLEIWLPAEQLDSLSLKVNAGNLLLENVQSKELILKLNAGKLSVQNIRADRAEVKVNAGSCDFAALAPITDSLQATVNAGDLNLYLPRDQRFDLRYDVSAGDFTHSFPDEKVVWRGDGVRAKKEGELTHGEGSAICQINIRVNAGSVSLHANDSAARTDD